MKLLNLVLLITVVIAGITSFYKFYYQADFDYYVEAACDSSVESCFYRPCDLYEDECLPNNLSVYKGFYVKAYDFPKCRDNSCKLECETGFIECEEILCDESAGDQCL